MSVGEWLNSVIQRTDEEDFTDDARLAQRMRSVSGNRRDHIDDEAPPPRQKGAPYRDTYRSEREPSRSDRDDRRSDRDDRQREWDRDDERAAVRRDDRAREDRDREARDREERDREDHARQEFGEVHARLDRLSRQLERLARTEGARRATPPPASGKAGDDPAPLTGAPPQRRRSAADSPLSIEAAVAEITARQRVLDREPPAAAGDSAPAVADSAAANASAATLDFSGLEKQLRAITTRIEALQPSSDIEKAIAAVRGDLTEIGRQLNEALPRRAVESLEIEVKALAERIDHSRQSGVDTNALTGLERGLADIREALRGLTPAENLVGFEDAVRALVQKVDLILAKDDPSALQQLEAAIGGLRGIVSHVASNDTLARVAEEVRALAAQVDGIANNAATGQAVSVLEKRIDTLAAALNASSEAGQAVPRDLEKLLAGLIEKLEWVQLTHTDHAALAHLEDRIAMLVQRFDASDARLGHLEAIERGLADLLVHIEQMRGLKGTEAAGARLVPPAAHAIERDVAAIKDSDRRTRDSLEAVQGTVEHVVDRLATIESDLHRDGAPEPAPVLTPAPKKMAPHEAAPAVTGGEPVTPAASAAAPAAQQTEPRAATARPPIDPTLPPDHPLEPGFAAGRSRTPPSAAERVAASEAAVGSAKPPVIADSGRPNFIAAARRAARAAAWEPARDQDGAEKAAPEQRERPSKLSERLRKLIVAGSAVLILAGCLRIGLRLFDGDGGSGAVLPARSQHAPPENAGPPLSILPAGRPPSTVPAPSSAAKPARQSMLHEGDGESVAGVSVQSADRPAAMPSWISPDITGALPPSEPAQSIAPALDRNAVVDDKLPAAIGDPALRAAAMAGNPAAAYEVAMRFAEGRGVAQNQAEEARWLQRAAKQGLAPAQFRLGGLYEKGLGVGRDLAMARDLYLAAARKGNGKAMHNLAVLYAEGVNGPPDYNKAAAWFRKAADHGIRDSQYNLGILYARGIGVERGDVESYKWFALAAKQGDRQAGRKRDEIASRLDPHSLAAVRLAVQEWKPEPQPEDAISVKTAAAWDPPAKYSRAARPKWRARAPAADR